MTGSEDTHGGGGTRCERPQMLRFHLHKVCGTDGVCGAHGGVSRSAPVAPVPLGLSTNHGALSGENSVKRITSKEPALQDRTPRPSRQGCPFLVSSPPPRAAPGTGQESGPARAVADTEPPVRGQHCPSAPLLWGRCLPPFPVPAAQHAPQGWWPVSSFLVVAEPPADEEGRSSCGRVARPAMSGPLDVLSRQRTRRPSRGQGRDPEGLRQPRRCTLNSATKAVGPSRHSASERHPHTRLLPEGRDGSRTIAPLGATPLDGPVLVSALSVTFLKVAV